MNVSQSATAKSSENPAAPVAKNSKNRRLIAIFLEEHIRNFTSLNLNLTSYLDEILNFHSNNRLLRHINETEEYHLPRINTSTSVYKIDKKDGHKYILYSFGIPVGMTSKVTTCANNQTVTMMPFDSVIDLYNQLLKIMDNSSAGIQPECPMTADFQTYQNYHKNLVSSIETCQIVQYKHSSNITRTHPEHSCNIVRT